ncbi:GNAT family N-acetyltransferase [Gluconacetobacter asukensis]|uniref:GNAT family N-acetyltransferase n=1 Tax=Gluconacetobacter asukensis TaxID=1017181 RepID=UPI0031EC15E7
MKNVQVRELRASDLDTVAQLWHASALSTGLDAHTVSAVAEYRERLEFEWTRAWRVYVARDGAEIVGFLAFEPGESWLRQLFVAPMKKRSGIGSILLDVAKRDMHEGFWLRTGSGNVAARRFYERHGLRKSGESPHDHLPIMVVRYQWSPAHS